MKSFGDRLRELRDQRDISQKELADKLGVNKQTISQYERDVREPSLDMLSSLCDFFNVSADYILGKTNVTPRFLNSEQLALLAENGVPLEVISRRLGHADSSITRDIYFHVTKRLAQQDADLIKSIKIV